MLKKHLAAMLLIAIGAAAPLGAASVSFLVIETGIPADIPAPQYSILWENCLLDVFYESGHIVSNAPMLRLAVIPADGFPDEAESNIREAINGGMEYFFIAIVKFPGNSVSMRLFKARSRTMIDEQSYTGKLPINMREERESIRNAIRVIAARVME